MLNIGKPVSWWQSIGTRQWLNVTT